MTILSTLIQALPSLASTFVGARGVNQATQPYNPSQGEQLATQLIGQQMPLISQYLDYGRMMADPNNATFQALVRQEEGNAAQSFAEALNQAVTENRRQNVLGRTPLFDAERGGEVRFRAMMGARNDARKQAQEAALKRLGLAADTTSNAMQLYQNPISNYLDVGKLQSGRDVTNRGLQNERNKFGAQLLGSNQVGSIAQAIASMFGRR